MKKNDDTTQNKTTQRNTTQHNTTQDTTTQYDTVQQNKTNHAREKNNMCSIDSSPVDETSYGTNSRANILTSKHGTNPTNRLTNEEKQINGKVGEQTKTSCFDKEARVEEQMIQWKDETKGEKKSKSFLRGWRRKRRRRRRRSRGTICFVLVCLDFVFT